MVPLCQSGPCHVHPLSNYKSALLKTVTHTSLILNTHQWIPIKLNKKLPSYIWPLQKPLHSLALASL